MKQQWHILQPDPATVRQLGQALGIHAVTAAVLANRGFLSAERAHAFLSGSIGNLRTPFALKDMDAAVDRIATAISRREKILIFGDYDVDGVTATALLLDFFRYVGADVAYYIPHRIKEGYSIQPEHVAGYAHPHHIDLIITADCGSGSHEAAQIAGDLGIDLIITDHHNIGETIPAAAAVINPKRPDCTAGLQNLAGVGVAFFLLISLRKHLRDKDFWQHRPEPNLKNYCDLVALGTVADMVPLIEENRILCKTGLALVNSGRRLGLKALMEASAVKKDVLDAGDIAFRLAPRLNAAGRIDHASMAVDLLTTADADVAGKTAETLNLLNQKRQKLEKEILDEIQLRLKIDPRLLRQHSLILSGPGWHAGVLGIVASRMVDAVSRPVVLITTEDGMGKGSARSIPGLDLYKALSACERYLENFGGHSMAAGLKILEKNIADFQNAFEEVIRRTCRPEDLVPSIPIDAELNFSEITDKLIDDLESLTPFGAGNPEPLFTTRQVAVESSKIVGSSHRQMLLGQSSRNSKATIAAIQFNADKRIRQKNSFDQIVFRLRWNRWNGRKMAQLVIEDLK